MAYIQALYFLGACLLMWYSSDMVIGSLSRVARRLKVSSFAVSFIVLGTLTSLTEMSVGISSLSEKNPDVFVGNLIGSAFTLIVFIIPLFAYLSKGLKIRQTLRANQLAFLVMLLIGPSAAIMDGVVSIFEAILLILGYGLFLFTFQKNEHVLEHVKFADVKRVSLVSLGVKIILGAVGIYVAGILLVNGVIYFATMLKVPAFLVSIFALSIGTNLPELTVSVKALLSQNGSIAFGTYAGSALMNTLLFGLFSLPFVPFAISADGLLITIFIVALGYLLFYLFARSKHHLNRWESLVLLGVFVAFICYQLTELVMNSAALS